MEHLTDYVQPDRPTVAAADLDPLQFPPVVLGMSQPELWIFLLHLDFCRYPGLSPRTPNWGYKSYKYRSPRARSQAASASLST